MLRRKPQDCVIIYCDRSWTVLVVSRLGMEDAGVAVGAGRSERDERGAGSLERTPLHGTWLN